MAEPSAQQLRVQLEAVQLGRRQVLSGIELTCSPGQHLAVLGPNGAGKTTLLRCIAGLVPYRGSILLGSTALDQLPMDERARRIAYVPQRSQLDAALSVWDVVMQGRYCHQDVFGRVTATDRAAVESALTATDAQNLAQRQFIELSGGEQRRALLARALATEAGVLLLDEPVASLDVAHALSVFGHIRALTAAGKCVVSTLHTLPDAERFSDQTAVLCEGKLRYLGPPELPAEVVAAVYAVNAEPRTAPTYSLRKEAE